VLLCGEDITGRPGKISYMLQKDLLLPHKKVADNVALPLVLRGEKTKAAREKALGYFAQFGLEGTQDQYPAQLSGGMRQRCALIRTLAAQPKVLLLDEPFSALDYQTRLAVSADIYRIIRQEGKTALLVTHDISEAISLSDRVVVLSHRPAVVKSIHRLTQLQGVPPLQRRDHPAFAGYFKSIWKELEVHEG